MPTSYVFDSALNLDQCFQNTPPSTLPIDDLHQLPKDWLIELENQCRKIKPDLEKNIFLKHVGPNSTYKLKAILLKQLSFVFYQISDYLPSELLKHESSQLLLLVLTEDINECTPGFHIRVNKLVNALQVPNTLEQLLYLVRKNIVHEIAYNLMSSVPPPFQVHVVDRVCRIAKKQGLGIEAIIQKDPYKSLLSDQAIHECLQSKFPLHYTPFKIPFLLAEQLQAILNQSGYIGSQETGYATGPVESMLKIIQNFLVNPAKPNTNKLQPLFILDKFDEFGEPTRIYDLNWPLIRQLFFQQLIDKNYFTKAAEPASLIEYAYFQTLLPEKTNSEIENQFIKDYLESENYARLLDDLTFIQTNFSEYWQKLIKNPILIQNIDNFLSFIDNQSKNIADDKGFLEKENQTYLLLFSQDKEFILRKIIVEKNTCITDVNHSLLLKSVRYFPEITKDFFNLLFNTPNKPYQLFFDLLFKKNHQDNTLLMFAARYHTETIKLILHFLNKYIDQIEKEKISALFISQNNNGWNLLSLAARHRSDALQFIFDFMNQKHIKFFDKASLQQLFLQQNLDGWNLLSMACVHPANTKLILDFINAHLESFDAETIKKIILQKDKDGYTCLDYAARFQPDSLKFILDFINTHPDSFDVETIKKIILQKDKDGYTCLHCAARFQPDSLKFFLDFIDIRFTLFAKKLKLLFESPGKFQLITTLYRNPTNKSIDLLAFSLKYPESAAHLLKFLIAHANIFNLEDPNIKNFINQASNKALLDDEDLKSVVPRIN
ncbi:hypothetical protein [Rickettsiella endosymbiont of Rhagonycha lignosa]|uniref:hypothetical protein n=1 Tax=Rickettsiella endosymbiont of Rhagonycha lignosa TaxID=3077937 RepID=UPI00313BBD28